MLVQDPMERHASHVLPGAESVGIITIEDVIEELLQQARQLAAACAVVACPVKHCALSTPLPATSLFLDGIPIGYLLWPTATCAMPLDDGVKAAACGALTLILVLKEIVDETDRYIDNLRLQRVNAALLTSNLPRHLRKCAALPWALSCGPKQGSTAHRGGAATLRLQGVQAVYGGQPWAGRVVHCSQHSCASQWHPSAGMQLHCRAAVMGWVVRLCAAWRGSR